MDDVELYLRVLACLKRLGEKDLTKFSLSDDIKTGKYFICNWDYDFNQPTDEELLSIYADEIQRLEKEIKEKEKENEKEKIKKLIQSNNVYTLIEELYKHLNLDINEKITKIK